MKYYIRLTLFFVFISLHLFSVEIPTIDMTQFGLENAPIDVVIPCAKKDVETLDFCIDGIKRNGKNIRRVIVVSSRPFSYNAEWFDEALFPFSKLDVMTCIFSNNHDKALDFIKNRTGTTGWIYQQLLKLYAPLVIPDISPNVLVLDADTIFLNPVEFTNEQGDALFNTRKARMKGYFAHIAKLLPDMKLYSLEHSGVTHHMLFQRPVIEHLFDTLSSIHDCEPWEAIVSCVGRPRKRCMSEYEIYFNFYYNATGQMLLRPLKWKNTGALKDMYRFGNEGFHYISCHTYLRN